MTTWGVTGHMDLGPETRRLVAADLMTQLSAGLAPGEPLVGLSCLAAGADQVFAFVVTALGGDLVFVKPCTRIKETVSGADLLGMHAGEVLAIETDPMPFDEPANAAYAAANDRILERCDGLVAIYDSGPSGGQGGTAELVEIARAAGKRVLVVWPEGAVRG